MRAEANPEFWGFEKKYIKLKQDFINFEVEDRGFSFEKLMRLDTKLTKILKGGLRTNI